MCDLESVYGHILSIAHRTRKINRVSAMLRQQQQQHFQNFLNTAISPIGVLLHCGLSRQYNIKVDTHKYVITRTLRELARNDSDVIKVKKFFAKPHISNRFMRNLAIYTGGPQTIYNSWDWCDSVKHLYVLYFEAIGIYGEDEFGNTFPRCLTLLKLGCNEMVMLEKIFAELNWKKSHKYMYTKKDMRGWEYQRKLEDKQRQKQDGILVEVKPGITVHKDYVQQYHLDRLRALRDQARGIDRRFTYTPTRYTVETPSSSEDEYSSDEENAKDDDDVAVITN